MKPACPHALLIRWLEAHLQGADLAAHDLCPDQPLLAERLQPMLDHLRQMNRLLADTSGDTSPLAVNALHTDCEAPPGNLNIEAATVLPRAEAPGVRPNGEADPFATIGPTNSPASLSAHVPGYEMLDELGRGGMGVVYKARQIGLGRVVALKMILAGGHAGAAELARFKTEAEAIARLQHPGIVQVYEVGEHDGKPFFSLEFCEGGGLDHKLAGNPMPPQDGAELAEVLARAMHAAHQAHVVHRDLKPANVLMTASGRPKITDFGLAKKLDEAGQTNTGAVMGTPSYMAPEQAEGKKEIGPATDVYALGAILYEMLTGRPPFKAASAFDTIMQVINDDPVPPTQLNAKAPADLETICLTCLQKDARRRYSTAEALAEDLARWRRGEPIQARPVGSIERAWRWGRRNPVVAGLAAAVMVVLLAGIGFSTSFAVLAKKSEERANEKAEEARNLAEEEKKQREHAEANGKEAKKAIHYLNIGRHGFQMSAAWQAWQQNEVASAETYLDEVSTEFQQTWEYRHLRDLCRRKAIPLKGHTDKVLCVAIGPDGKHIVSGSADKTLKVWDSITGQDLLTLKGHSDSVNSVAFSPDGKRIVSGGADKTVRVWDAHTGKELRFLEGHTDSVTSVAISPDGEQSIVSGSADKTVRVWDAGTAKVRLTLAGHTDQVSSVAISPDGKRIVSGSVDRSVKVWDAGTGQELHTFAEHTDSVTGVAISPDGRRIVSGSADNTLKMWDSVTWKDRLTLKGHTESVMSVAYSPDGQRIVSGSIDKTLKVWDARTGQELQTFKGHSLAVSSVAISPDGKHIVSGSHDKSLKVWDTHVSQDLLTLKGHTDKVLCAAINPDGKYIVSGSADKTLKVWDARVSEGLLTLKGHTDRILCLAISPDGKYIISGSADNTLKVWDARTGENLITLAGHTGAVHGVAISTDGTVVVSGSADKTLKVWNGQTGKELYTLRGHTDGVRSVAIGADGKRIISGSHDRTLKVWDAGTRQDLLTLKGHSDSVSSVAISPDGKHIFSGSADNSVKVWDAITGHSLLTLKGHTEPVSSLAISADGTRIVSGSLDNTLKIWGSHTGQDLLTLKGHTGDVTGVAIGPDGNLVVSASDDRTVKVWDAPTTEHPLTLEEQYRLRLEEEPIQRQLRARANREYHAAEAETAEQNHQAFAAVFHLNRLLPLDPEECCLLRARRHAVLTEALTVKSTEVWAARALSWQITGEPASESERAIRLTARSLLAKEQDAPHDARYGALLLRTGSAREAILVLRAALALPRRGPEAPPVEELLLSLAHEQLGQREPARRYFTQADAWRRQGRQPLRAASSFGAAATSPLPALAMLAALAAPPADPRLAIWEGMPACELDLLYAEAEKCLGSER